MFIFSFEVKIIMEQGFIKIFECICVSVVSMKYVIKVLTSIFD